MVLANESTFVSKLLGDLTGRRGREGEAEGSLKGRNAGSDLGVCNIVLGSVGRARENADGASDASSGV